MRFSSRSTRRVINPEATGWVERKHLPFHPRPGLGLRRPALGLSSLLLPLQKPARTREGLELSGVCGRPAARAPRGARSPPMGARGLGLGACGAAAGPIRLPARPGGGQGRRGEGRGGRGRWRQSYINSSFSPWNARAAPAPPARLQPPALSPASSPCSPRGRGGRQSPSGCWPPFYAVRGEAGGGGALGAGELTSGPAGLSGAGRAGEERRGLREPMRGPWAGRRRSWDCPACARCGLPCSRCSPAGPKGTGCEYWDGMEGGNGGARGRWHLGCPASANFQPNARGPKAVALGRVS